ncbi:MAG: hypothetical protein LBU77_05460 [Clostridiales bacterium]|jgi:hypothetical protein|nr:hypothetical protein [Clostridiales bacterium]
MPLVLKMAASKADITAFNNPEKAHAFGDCTFYTADVIRSLCNTSAEADRITAALRSG